ncbi:MAG: hypothetical protein C0404_03990 [Verrucomicrobia bacterium]|nr:hypothetical protein [Verrucomicrobiota bacterium]
MKKILHIIAIVVLGLVPFAGCDKSDDDDDGGATVSAGMTEQQVVAAWGQPDRIVDERPNGIDNYLWDYGYKQYIGFDYRVQFASGKVKSILVIPGQPQGGRWVDSWTK